MNTKLILLFLTFVTLFSVVSAEKSKRSKIGEVRGSISIADVFSLIEKSIRDEVTNELLNANDQKAMTKIGDEMSEEEIEVEVEEEVVDEKEAEKADDKEEVSDEEDEIKADIEEEKDSEDEAEAKDEDDKVEDEVKEEEVKDEDDKAEDETKDEEVKDEVQDDQDSEAEEEVKDETKDEEVKDEVQDDKAEDETKDEEVKDEVQDDKAEDETKDEEVKDEVQDDQDSEAEEEVKDETQDDKVEDETKDEEVKDETQDDKVEDETKDEEVKDEIQDDQDSEAEEEVKDEVQDDQDSEAEETYRVPVEDADIKIEEGKFSVIAAEDNIEDEGLDVGEGDDDAKIGTVLYQVDEEEQKKLEGEEGQKNYFDVDETDNKVNDVFQATVKDAKPEVESDIEDEEKSGSHLGSTLAVIGAFGVVLAFGYKYTHHNKRVLLPFEDLLEKGELGDKSSNEQQIIPVWAATSAKEENEDANEQVCEVVYAYEPELPDELKLSVGDKIKIKEIYEDGWGFGYNKTTQLFGTFPTTSFGENFNMNSVAQSSSDEATEIVVEEGSVEELKKKIVESN